MTGVGVYSIGPYVSWPGTGSPGWSTSDANNFCTNVSSWAFNANALAQSATFFVYLEDEALNNSPKYSEWMSTVTACQVADEPLSWVTSDYPAVNTSAPFLRMPSTTGWIGASSGTWITDVSSYTTRPNIGYFYNSHPPWGGSVYATEDDGIGPLVITWAGYKKGLNGWFAWQTTYWSDNNVKSCGNTDLFHQACTFDCCTPSNSSTQGLNNGNYSNGDGVLLYPGHDVVFTPDYGFDGPIPSWRLKMLRRGIQDYDYLVKANTINTSSVTAIVSNAVNPILYEYTCQTLADCSYGYGPRGWSRDPGPWATNREDLANIIAGAATTPVPSSEQWQGGIKAQGGISFQ
jgi:hypothetical protein